MTMLEKAPAPAKPETKGARHFDPLETFDLFQDEMTRFFQNVWPFGPIGVARPIMRATTLLDKPAFTPRLDLFEQNGCLVAKVELPGVKREDIEVLLQDGDVLIKGERKAEQEVKEKDYYRMERAHGVFFRRLPLPFEVKAEAITATFTDGVLEVKIPKPAETKTQPQPITIA